MAKIPLEYEDIIDKQFLLWSDDLFPSFKSCKFTPNTITTFALLSTLIAIYLIIIHDCRLAGFFYLISYFFDTMDGRYARTYKMTSKFGDYYDHIVDWIRNGGVLFMIIYCYYYEGSIIPLIIITILFILGNMKQAYQEKYYILQTRKYETESLNFLQQIFNPPNDLNIVSKKLKYLKYTGWGIFTIVVTLFLGHCDDYKYDDNKIIKFIRQKIE